MTAQTTSTIAGRIQAYDGLAFNARASKRPADAEAAYREGMQRLPAAAAHFHFQLGRHYQLAGRPVHAPIHIAREEASRCTATHISSSDTHASR